jgi:hypothetical protein
MPQLPRSSARRGSNRYCHATECHTGGQFPRRRRHTIGISQDVLLLSPPQQRRPHNRRAWGKEPGVRGKQDRPDTRTDGCASNMELRTLNARSWTFDVPPLVGRKWTADDADGPDEDHHPLHPCPSAVLTSLQTGSQTPQPDSDATHPRESNPPLLWPHFPDRRTRCYGGRGRRSSMALRPFYWLLQ